MELALDLVEAKGASALIGLRFYLALAFFSLGIGSTEASANPLLSHFCAQLTIEYRSNTEGFLDEHFWEMLNTAFEQGAVTTEALDGESSAGYLECLQKYSKSYGTIFEKGNFILKGKKLVSKLPDTQSRKNDVQLKREEAAVVIPNFSVITLSPTRENNENKFALRLQLERQKRYQELWVEFLEDLRELLIASVKTNPPSIP